MELSNQNTFYEVLDLSADASPQEIRSAYLRAKASFQKENLALYSLLDPTEAEIMIKKIEEAYQTLSHPEKKLQYDQTFIESFPPKEESSPSQKIFSIDRVPPMDSLVSEEILVAPSTDASMKAKLESPSSVLEWSGAEIRKQRELKNIPLETLVESTKIRKSYLLALENEEFSKLPARVFVRGFLQQIARELKIPSETLIESYLARFQQWTVSESKKSG